MLLQLQNTTRDNVDKLLEFARQNNLELRLIDGMANGYYHLPGEPLTPGELSTLIESSRNSGTISLEEAHALIRNNTHADQLHH